MTSCGEGAARRAGRPLTRADCGPGAGHAQLPVGAGVLSSPACELFHREALDLLVAITFRLLRFGENMGYNYILAYSPEFDHVRSRINVTTINCHPHKEVVCDCEGPLSVV